MAMMRENDTYKPLLSDKEGVEELAEQAMDCLLSLLREDNMSLTRNSADFLIQIEKLWEYHHIPSRDIWHELMARMDLSEELLRRGIRAQKGGQYRSTKLP